MIFSLTTGASPVPPNGPPFSAPVPGLVLSAGDYVARLVDGPTPFARLRVQRFVRPPGVSISAIDPSTGKLVTWSSGAGWAPVDDATVSAGEVAPIGRVGVCSVELGGLHYAHIQDPPRYDRLGNLIPDTRQPKDQGVVGEFTVLALYLSLADGATPGSYTVDVEALR